MHDSSLPPLTLVLGGTRSGKSAFAERMVEDAGDRALYLATARAMDAEMAERIRRHRDRRGEMWDLLEEPLELVEALRGRTRADRPVLVDCLTLWLSNLMAEGRNVATESAALVEALGALKGPVIFVSNEVGLGIVPDNALARRFRDLNGSLNQSIALMADKVVFLAAGLPVILKDLKAN